MALTFKVKNFFFDRQKVKDAIDKAKLRWLPKNALAIRTIARRSMRQGSVRGKGRTASKGSPPYFHTRDLKDKIFAGFDFNKGIADIGPVRFKQGMAPKVLEFGGTETIKEVRRGVTTTRVAHYSGNAYMAPALEKQRPKMPAEWKGSVRSS